MFIFSKTYEGFSFNLFSPFRWRRGRIARALRVPLAAVYVHFNYYNPIVRKNYVTVNFFDNESLQVKEIISANFLSARLEYLSCI
jgi:hypothetical protein